MVENALRQLRLQAVRDGHDELKHFAGAWRQRKHVFGAQLVDRDPVIAPVWHRFGLDVVDDLRRELVDDLALPVFELLNRLLEDGRHLVIVVVVANLGDVQMEIVLQICNKF